MDDFESFKQLARTYKDCFEGKPEYEYLDKIEKGIIILTPDQSVEKMCDFLEMIDKIETIKCIVCKKNVCESVLKHINCSVGCKLNFHIGCEKKIGGSCPNVGCMGIFIKNIIPPLSDEQKKVVDSSVAEQNVIVDSVFGSGKTTTILHICMAVKKRILCLTYNARLKIETRNKILKLGITNVEAHSYHAFCVKYYDDSCITDTKIISVVDEDIKPKNTINFEMIILDEQQDMTPEYFRLVQKIQRDNVHKDVQFAIFGDIKQSIYPFKGSDYRFLTMAEKIFNSPFRWISLKINTSFRATKQIANFINTQLLGYQRIIASKEGPNVRYLICDSFSSDSFNEIKYYLDKGYDPDDFFILTPSLRSAKTPTRRLENMLVEKKYPCYTPSNDNDQIKEEDMRGKFVFATFHQVKGLERKVVIVFNFDSSYMEFYAKDEPKNVCPNAIYVATSRSLERMTVIHESSNDYFPTINFETLSHSADIINQSHKRFRSVRHDKINKSTVHQINVTDLLRHLNACVIEHLMTMIKYSTIEVKSEIINIPARVQTKDERWEYVADLNGIAIPAFYEMIKKGIPTILKHIENNLQEIYPEHITRINEIKIRINQQEYIQEDILYLACIYDSIFNGYGSRREQLTKYTKFSWIEKYSFDQALERLNSKLKPDAVFETHYERRFGNTNILGCIDAIQNDELWELKCTHTLDDIHIIQLAIYSWLCSDTKSKLYLFNILTNELIRIDSITNKDEFINYIITSKYGNLVKMSDDEFIKNIRMDVVQDELLKYKVIVFDTETTGFPDKISYTKYYPYTKSDAYNHSRLVSICWNIYDETGRRESSEYHILKPNGFYIGQKSTEIHGISHEYAMTYGKERREILKKFVDATQNIKYIVGHNVMFDKHIVLSELFRSKIDGYERISKMKYICTLELARKQHNKHNTLTDVYERLFNEKFDAHNAKADTDACARCYFKMNNDIDIISFEKQKTSFEWMHYFITHMYPIKLLSYDDVEYWINKNFEEHDKLLLIECDKLNLVKHEKNIFRHYCDLDLALFCMTYGTLNAIILNCPTFGININKIINEFMRMLKLDGKIIIINDEIDPKIDTILLKKFYCRCDGKNYFIYNRS